MVAAFKKTKKPDMESLETLTPNDIDDFSKCFIPPRMLAQAGIYRVDTIKGAELVGKNTKAGTDYAGIIYPYFWPGESLPYETRLRRDHPEKRTKPDGTEKQENKYLSPPGRRGLLYIPPGTPTRFLNDNSIPVIILEGEKKALAVCQVFQTPTLILGIPGVNGWRCQIGIEVGPDGEKLPVKGPIPRFDKISWTGRDVTIIFDADISTNQNVFFARQGLAKELTGRGANVHTLDIPECANGGGIDDLLAFHGIKFFKKLFKNRDTFTPKNLAGDIHRDLNKLPQPTVVVNQKYLDIDIPGEGIISIKSAMGTGKTELIKGIISDNSLNSKKSFLLGSRNSLLRQTCTRAGFTHIHELAKKPQIDNTENLALCVDSLKRISIPESGYDVFIDESESVIQHLLIGETCKSNRGDLLNQFTGLVQNADRIFLLDAGLTGVVQNYIQKICGGRQTHLVVNTYPIPKWNVFFHSGVTGKNGLRTTDRSGITSEILKSIGVGEKPIILSDSQEFIESLERLILDEFPEKNGLRVDSRTTASDHADNNKVHIFLADPNTWVGLEKPEYLLCSPTVESGVSITQPHFGKVFGVFTGTVTTPTILQMLGRYRVPVDRHIWVKPFGKPFKNNTSSIPTEIHRNLFRFHSETIKAIAIQRLIDSDSDFDDTQLLETMLKLREGERWTDPHLETLCNLIARHNLEMGKLRDRLRQALVESGHNVIARDVKQSEQTSSIKQNLVEQKKELRLEQAEAIATARDIDTVEVDSIKGQPTRTIQEQNELDKYFLSKSIPGIQITPDLVHNLVFEHSGIIKKLSLFVLTGRPELAEMLDVRVYRERKKLDQSITLNDLKPDLVSQQVQILNELGIPEICHTSPTFTQNDKLVDEVVKKLSQPGMIERVKRHLGLTVNQIEPVQMIGRLAGKLGFRLNSKQVRDGDKRYRVYTVCPVLDSELHDQILKSIESRFLSHLSSYNTCIRMRCDKIESAVNSISGQFECNPFQAHEESLGLPSHWVKITTLKWLNPDYQFHDTDTDQLSRRFAASRVNDPHAVSDITDYLNSIRQWVSEYHN